MAADEQRFLTAIHEAGHVVAWLAAERRVQSAWIDDQGNGRVRPLARWCRDREFLARAALAGPIAESHYRLPGTPPDPAAHSAETDVAHALRYLGAAALPRGLVTDVERLVVAHGRLIVDVAGYLYRQGRLNRRQLCALRQQHTPDQDLARDWARGAEP